MVKPSKIVASDPHEVHFAEKIINSAAVPLFAEAWSYLLDSRLAGESAFPDWTSFVFWVQGKGLITFTHDEAMGRLWIGMAYVRVSVRKQGVFQALWRCVEEFARSKGCHVIGCGVSPSNSEMRAIGRRFGQLRSLEYEFSVTAIVLVTEKVD